MLKLILVVLVAFVTTGCGYSIVLQKNGLNVNAEKYRVKQHITVRNSISNGNGQTILPEGTVVYKLVDSPDESTYFVLFSMKGSPGLQEISKKEKIEVDDMSGWVEPTKDKN